MRFAALFWLLLLASPAFAQDVGRVHFLSGESDLERQGRAEPLRAFAQVRQGDVIRTGADGHVQLVMVDGARIALRPKSQLKLDKYEFNTQTKSAGQALLSLIAGTMRVFTGEIVNRDRDRFQMKTNLATVGIRGSGNILANLDGAATLNYTIIGAHSVTSRDPLGIERTIISYPGQTVQVLPGQPPRYVPTPALILQAASTPAVARASDKASDTAAASAAGGATSSGSSSASSSSSSSSSSGSSTTASSGSGTTTESPPASSSGGTTAASTAPTTTSEAPPTTAQSGTSTTTTTTSPSGTSTIASPSPTVGTSQANNGTVGSSIGTSQPPASNGYEVVLRFFNPIPSGYEAAFAEGSGGAVIDAAGRLVQLRDADFSTFLAGPGSVPSGYNETSIAGDVTFSGGTHRDAFRSSDGSVILGRWEGGSVTVGSRTFDLGPRSVTYEVTTPTPAGIVGSFTGSATYSLAGATAPTDASGHTGTVNSATVSANFTSRTVAGNFGLSINGQNFSLSGNASLEPGSSAFAFASSLQNLTIACTGSCSTAGYLGTMNGQFAGSAGRWLSMSYRLNPNRAAQSGFSDFVIGNMALEAGGSPTIGIVLPQTGTASLAFNTVDPSRSFSTYANATGTPTITGTVSANFTNHTAAFNATVSGNNGPTFTASASNMQIVGAGFSASTDPQRPSTVAPMSVSCSGSGCGSSASGRFDGLFRNSAGTLGVASLVVGDTAGAYEVVASFGTGTAAAMFASDARALARQVNPGAPLPSLISTLGLNPSFARVARNP